eukprot:2214607-Rhodomonas_salina.2
MVGHGHHIDAPVLSPGRQLHFAVRQHARPCSSPPARALTSRHLPPRAVPHHAASVPGTA